jgi:hypothetical protein
LPRTTVPFGHRRGPEKSPSSLIGVTKLLSVP